MTINGYYVLKKGDLPEEGIFSNTFPFRDHSCAISDHPEFERNFQNMYYSESQLKKENVSNSEASFLELSIIIENNQFKTQL